MAKIAAMRAGARGYLLKGSRQAEIVRAVISRLDEAEPAVLVGKGATPDAYELLTSLSPGSRLRKAPRDLVKRRIMR